VLAGLGSVESRLGRLQEAVDHSRQALALIREIGYRFAEAAALNCLADSLLGAGEPDQARAQFRDALSVTFRPGLGVRMVGDGPD
jgi:tetratricopeptide (TPR) repeat protein